MIVSELIEKLLVKIERYGDVPVYDWDNDEITSVEFQGAEMVAYGGLPIEARPYPDRIVLGQ